MVMEILHYYHSIWKYARPHWGSCLGRGCGANVPRCKCFLAFLFQFHFTCIWWWLSDTPGSLVQCCVDAVICSLRNRKFNIVWEVGECFQGDQGKFWISQKVTFSVTLSLSSKRLSHVGKGYVTRQLPKLCRFLVFLFNLYFLSEV